MTDMRKINLDKAKVDMKHVMTKALNILLAEPFDTDDTDKDNLDKCVTIYDKLTELSPPHITSTHCGHMVMNDNEGSKLVRVNQVAFLLSSDIEGSNGFIAFNYNKNGYFTQISCHWDGGTLGEMYIDGRGHYEVATAVKPFAEWLKEQFKFYT